MLVFVSLEYPYLLQEAARRATWGAVSTPTA